MAILRDTTVNGDMNINGTVSLNASISSRDIVENYWVVEGQKILATDPQSSNYFGTSVAISGDYAIVGAAGEGTNNVGKAYIYRKSGTNTWGEGFKITATVPEDGAFFGWSVAISGDYAIVGAFGEDTGGSNAGAAYVYRRTGTNTWGEGFKIMATDPQASDNFGWSVAISGDYAIVGAHAEDTGGSNAGAAYIYHRTGTNTWGEGFKIMATDPQASALFGESVSISGDYAIVGAKQNATGGYGAGAAYIYHRTDINTWDSGVKITATDPAVTNYFGVSVSISGDYAIVGTEGNNANFAYIYHRTDINTWDSGVKITSADVQAEEYFGFSVAISGDYAIVGAHGESAGSYKAGAAYIYHRTGTNIWGEESKIIATDPQADDRFGYSVSISGDYAIAGAYWEATGGTYAGAAYIYNMFKYLRFE